MTIKFRAMPTMPSAVKANRESVLLKFSDGFIVVAEWVTHIGNYDWCPMYSGESATHHHGQPVGWYSLSEGNDIYSAKELETMQKFAELEGEIERLKIELAERIIDVEDAETEPST